MPYVIGLVQTSVAVIVSTPFVQHTRVQSALGTGTRTLAHKNAPNSTPGLVRVENQDAFDEMLLDILETQTMLWPKGYICNSCAATNLSCSNTMKSLLCQGTSRDGLHWDYPIQWWHFLKSLCLPPPCLWSFDICIRKYIYLISHQSRWVSGPESNSSKRTWSLCDKQLLGVLTTLPLYVPEQHNDFM